MLIVGDRSCDHATPRQMALPDREIMVSPTAIDSTLGVIEECCRSANLSLHCEYKSLAHIALNLLLPLIRDPVCAPKANDYELTCARTSANMNVPTHFHMASFCNCLSLNYYNSASILDHNSQTLYVQNRM